MSLHYGLPPYADIVFQPDLQDRLGLERLGLLCRLITLAKPAGDGGWVITENMQTLADHLGVSRRKLSTELKAIALTGAIAIQPRTFHTDGGSTSQSYWLYPSLLTGGTLTPPTGGPRKSQNRTFPDGTFQNGTVHDGTFRNRHLVPVAAPTEPSNTTPSDTQQTGDVAFQELSNHQQHDGSNAAPSAIPDEVITALDGIGWAVAYPTDQPWDILLAVISHLRKQRKNGKIDSEAAVLNSMLRRGSLMKYARSNRLLATDLNGSLDPDPSGPRMSGLEYDTLAEQHPEWAQVVLTEARRQASVLGLLPKVPPSLIWTVAAATPLPDGQAVGQHG